MGSQVCDALGLSPEGSGTSELLAEFPWHGSHRSWVHLILPGGRKRSHERAGSFPFLAWAMLLVSKGCATSARGIDLDEAAECAFAWGFSFQL